MRLGKPVSMSQGWRKAGKNGKPKHITSEVVVGQVSADLISTYFAPKMQESATESMTRYAEDLLSYEDAVKELNTTTAESEIAVDGNILAEEELPSAPSKPFFHSQQNIDQLLEVFSDTTGYFFTKTGGWKIQANAAKAERTMDEKYGVFRPFIKQHPEIEHFVRAVQRKYSRGYFSPLRRGPPPISRTTSMILLFMINRGKMGWQVQTLAFLYLLIGLQPWALVLIIVLVQTIFSRRKQRTVGKMKRTIPAVEPYYSNSNNDEFLLKPVGTPLNECEEINTADYDTIMLGYGTSTLYSAALMARAGRKVLVLSSVADASGCSQFLETKDENLKEIPIDVQASNVSRISKQQQLLAPALATSTDLQGGIRFAKIGSEADGYTFEILSIPGMGTEGRSQESPFILKADGGVSSLMEDTSNFLGDSWPNSFEGPGDSLAGQYIQASEKTNASASLFYLTKIIPESINKMRIVSEYQNATLHNCTTLLNPCFQVNAHLRSLFAGIGMKQENLPPMKTSLAAHITNICASISPEGMHYPIGGPRALGHALLNVIERNGGRVVTEAPSIELIFDERIKASAQPKSDKTDDTLPAPCCVGVQLANGKEVRYSTDRYVNRSDVPFVVSMEGFIHTFIRLLPDNIRTTYKVPRGIPALSEQRPVMHVMFALKGSAIDLNITGADFYRLPGAAIATDEVNPETGEIKFGEIGWFDDDHDESEEKDLDLLTNKENGEAVLQPIDVSRKRKKNVFKYEQGRSWMRIAFPSAKDPSFESRHGKISICVVTVEAGDEFVTPYETKPKFFVNKKVPIGNLNALSDRVQKDLIALYPQLEEKILHVEVSGPIHKGLSHTPERYVAKGVRVDTPYPGLAVGGSDLTVGDSFSGEIVAGWLVANAVCGYSPIDHLFLQKNITTDIEQFLESPALLEKEDLAVPFTPIVVHFDDDENTKPSDNSSVEH